MAPRDGFEDPTGFYLELFLSPPLTFDSSFGLPMYDAGIGAIFGYYPPIGPPLLILSNTGCGYLAVGFFPKFFFYARLYSSNSFSKSKSKFLSN